MSEKFPSDPNVRLAQYALKTVPRLAEGDSYYGEQWSGRPSDVGNNRARSVMLMALSVVEGAIRDTGKSTDCGCGKGKVSVYDFIVRGYCDACGPDLNIALGVPDVIP